MIQLLSTCMFILRFVDHKWLTYCTIDWPWNPITLTASIPVLLLCLHVRIWCWYLAHHVYWRFIFSVQVYIRHGAKHFMIGYEVKFDFSSPVSFLSRFEVQIEVGLPNEEGRYVYQYQYQQCFNQCHLQVLHVCCHCRHEIFEIHTRSMREAGSLSPDVNLKELAANTTRFSGAEIAGLVRAATSYALDRMVSCCWSTSAMATNRIGLLHLNLLAHSYWPCNKNGAWAVLLFR